MLGDLKRWWCEHFGHKVIFEESYMTEPKKFWHEGETAVISFGHQYCSRCGADFGEATRTEYTE
jgi:hypothetical protein